MMHTSIIMANELFGMTYKFMESVKQFRNQNEHNDKFSNVSNENATAFPVYSNTGCAIFQQQQITKYCSILFYNTYLKNMHRLLTQLPVLFNTEVMMK